MHVALEDRNSYVQEPLDADDDAAVGAVGCLDDAAVGALKTNTAHVHVANFASRSHMHE